MFLAVGTLFLRLLDLCADKSGTLRIAMIFQPIGKYFPVPEYIRMSDNVCNQGIRCRCFRYFQQGRALCTQFCLQALNDAPLLELRDLLSAQPMQYRFYSSGVSTPLSESEDYT